MPRFKLSRRAFLRGMGVAGLSIALPPLEAMFAPRGLSYGSALGQTTAPPKRLILFYFPTGVYAPVPWEATFWYPVQEGLGWAMTPGLAPLQAFRDDINVIAGLSFSAAMSPTGQGSHKDWGAVLTGRPSTLVEHYPASNAGPSFDQVAAQTLGATTKFKSILTSTYAQPQIHFAANASVNGQHSLLPCVVNPRQIFPDFFWDQQAGGGAPDPRLLRGKSMLDFVQRDIGRLKGRLGVNDVRRLDEHLDTIRSIEASINTEVPATCEVIPRPADVQYTYQQWPEYAKKMMDLTLMALKCDLTRVAFFGMGETQCNATMPFIDLPLSLHNASHSGTAVEESQVAAAAAALGMTIEQYRTFAYRKATVWRMEQLAYFLGQLKNTPDSNGASMLENSVVIAFSEFSSGTIHHTDILPIIVAGKLGGMPTGRSIIYPCDMGDAYWTEYGACADRPGAQNLPVANLWLTALRALGAVGPTESFGNATGTLSGLWAG
ncbi:MAG: DUF1552 domain-containing protein [Myxococcaceae bacterium]